MFTMSGKDSEKVKKTSHLGADLAPSFVETFSNRVKEGGFTSKLVLMRLVKFWLELDPSEQVAIYHGSGIRTFADYVGGLVDARLAERGSAPSVSAATSGLTVEDLLFSMRHILSEAVFQRVMQDIEYIRLGTAMMADDGIPLEVAIERVRAAGTQYKLLSPEKQKWLDELQAEAIAAQRSMLAADQVADAAERDTKGGKQTTRRRGSSKGA